MYFKMVNYMLCEFYLNKKEKGLTESTYDPD